MVYIDNDGAKFSLVKGYSKSAAITSICAAAAVLLDLRCILPWCCRVPSSSNIADYPPRLTHHPSLEDTKELLTADVQVVFEKCLKLLSEVDSPQETWVGAARFGLTFPPSWQKVCECIQEIFVAFQFGVAVTFMGKLCIYIIYMLLSERAYRICLEVVSTFLLLSFACWYVFYLGK